MVKSDTTILHLRRLQTDHGYSHSAAGDRREQNFFRFHDLRAMHPCVCTSSVLFGANPEEQSLSGEQSHNDIAVGAEQDCTIWPEA